MPTSAVSRMLLILLVLFLLGFAIPVTRYFSQWLSAQGGVDGLALQIRQLGIWGPVVSLALMILQSVIAPLPSWLLTGANGAIYGVIPGGLLSWVGMILGASVNFGLARLLGGHFVRRMSGSGKWEAAEKLGANRGFEIVLGARLVPFISLDLVSYLAGLSLMRFAPFLMATALGLIPSTLAYATFGHDLLRARHLGWRLAVIAGFLFITFLVGKERHRIAAWWSRRRA